MGNLQELSDLNKTIKISARRFEESPYIERTYSPEMVRGVYAGRYFPMSVGEDPIKKYWLLRLFFSMYSPRWNIYGWSNF